MAGTWIVDRGAGGGGGSSGPFHRTMLFKNLTPKIDTTDHVTVFGAKEGESSTAFRIALTLRKTITADATVTVKLSYLDEVQTVGTYTMPSSQAINTPLIFKGPDILITTFPDMSVLWGDVNAADGTKDLDGVLSLTVWWKGRSSGLTTAPGMGTTGGSWDPVTIYDKGDVVEHEGNAYASTINDNVGIDPITGPIVRTGPAPLDAPLEWDLIAKGVAGTITVGTVTGVGPDEPPTVVNVGTDSAAILNFELQQGEKGDTGDVGPVGPPTVHGFGCTFDGGSAPLVSGMTAYVTVPTGGTIKAWNFVVDAGTCTVTLWKVARGTAKPTVANSISTSGVSLTTGTAIHSTVLTDFTTLGVADGDLVGIHLQSCTGARTINFGVEL